MAKPKFAKNSAEIEATNGEITFIAARSVKNLNGWTYEVSSLQAQDPTGEYHSLSNSAQEVSIPLMTDHDGSIKSKIGTIDTAKIVSIEGVDHAEMHAKFFSSDEAQQVRQRILDGELTDVSITTDWGSGYSEEDDDDTLKNAHIIEVSVVYAGAEPKAKILAKNSVDKDEPEVEEVTVTEDDVTTVTEDPEDSQNDVEEPETPEVEGPETPTVPEPDNDEGKNTKEEREEPEMANQPTNTTTERVADKAMVLNALAKLAENGSIRKLNRSQVIEAVKNEVTLTDADGDPYVVPDAIFTEILASTRPTDILQTFRTVPGKRWTEMSEVPSEADLARAGRWSKGEQKQIQESDLKAQKFNTQFLYKLQELSYEDLQEDFGELLYAFIRSELPQKAAEEEERDFIVGDGRASNAPRHISSIVSLKAAAADNANVHVASYNGSGDSSVMEAILKGIELLEEDGTLHLVARKDTLGALRRAGLSTNAALPYTNAQVADALDVDGLHKRSYVEANVAYVWVENKIVRLNPTQDGETIEQYDIDYNNQKIEFIKSVGGGATGLYSAVRIQLPTSVSA